MFVKTQFGSCLGLRDGVGRGRTGVRSGVGAAIFGGFSGATLTVGSTVGIGVGSTKIGPVGFASAVGEAITIAELFSGVADGNATFVIFAFEFETEADERQH